MFALDSSWAKNVSRYEHFIHVASDNYCFFFFDIIKLDNIKRTQLSKQKMSFKISGGKTNMKSFTNNLIEMIKTKIQQLYIL